MGRILKALHWKDWVYLVLSVGFIVLQVWLDLLLPDYTSTILQYAMTGMPMGEIWKQGGIMLACALGSAASSVIVGYFAARPTTSRRCRCSFRWGCR